MSKLLARIIGPGTDPWIPRIATHLVVLLVVVVEATLFKNKLKAPSFQIGSGLNLQELFFK